MLRERHSLDKISLVLAEFSNSQKETDDEEVIKSAFFDRENEPAEFVQTVDSRSMSQHVKHEIQNGLAN